MTVSSISKHTLRVLNIVPGTSVDGPGLRTSVYLAGCSHKCLGCHNPESWDISNGRDISFDELTGIIGENEENLTLTGGDPLFQADQLRLFLPQLKASLPDIDIWMYTGFKYEDIANDPTFSDVLKYIDVIVDSPYIEHLRDVSLRFRGSSNQRIIDIAASTTDKVVEWADTDMP